MTIITGTQCKTILLPVAKVDVLPDFDTLFMTGVNTEIEPKCQFVHRDTYEQMCDNPAVWSTRAKCHPNSAILACDPCCTAFFASTCLVFCRKCPGKIGTPQEIFTCIRL